MAWEPDYATVEDLRGYVRVEDTLDDAQMALAITAASRAIDRFCGRQFGNDEQTRVYESVDGVAIVDDLSRIDEVKLNGRVVDAKPWPFNAAAAGRPYERLSLPRDGEVEVAGMFGWPEIPDAVKQACLLQASRFLARRDSPFGVAGSPDFGGELRLLAKVDADVAVILASYRRVWGAV